MNATEEAKAAWEAALSDLEFAQVEADRTARRLAKLMLRNRDIDVSVDLVDKDGAKYNVVEATVDEHGELETKLFVYASKEVVIRYGTTGLRGLTRVEE